MSPSKIAQLENYAENQQKLLQLIDEGDPSSILSEDNGRGFNELMKYQLISIKNDKVLLTDLGREAQKDGIVKVLNQLKSPAPAVKLPNIPVPALPGNPRILWVTFLICLLILLVFLISKSTL